jgi:protein O-mannosyl-transferase
LRDLWERDWLKGLLLVAAILLAYQPAWQAGFIWDDDAHITRPELRSFDGLGRIWIQLGATQQYYPLVHSVFWLEHRFWGDWPMGYHLLNILLHAGSALLLVKVLQKLKIPGAWLAAVIFALHPIQVESVAWVSELKNTMSGIFYLGAALAYLGFDGDRRRGNYALALGLFILGLMAKTVIATLPAALLVVFWWQRGKWSWQRDVVPLIPFFTVGIVAGLFTAWVEQTFIIGTAGSEFNFSIVERFLIAGRATWFYLGKLFWPINLVFIYPRWQVSQGVWWQYLFPATMALLLGTLVWLRQPARDLLAALLFFVLTLFPALGFFNVYPFRYSFVADHFQYLAGIGPIVVVAAGSSKGFNWCRRRGLFWGPAVGGILLALLGILTWRQCRMYAGSETLWRTTVDRYPNLFLANNNIGVILARKGQLEEAAAYLQKASQSHPDDPKIRTNLGIALAKAYADYANTFVGMGWNDEAIVQFRKALEIRPDFADARHDLAVTLLQTGQVDEAIAQFWEIWKQYPDDPMASFDLGNAYFQKGQLEEAVAAYQRALKIRPDDVSARNNLGMALLRKGMVDEAVIQFREVLAIQPDFAMARTNLNKALRQKELP